MRSLLFLILLVSCSQFHKNKKIKLENAIGPGHYLVSGCSIYDLRGEMVRSYPGGQCFFETDGSLLSYDYEKVTLTKYSNQMKKIWSRKIHLHHDSISKTPDGNYVFLSSSIEKIKNIPKVRVNRLCKLKGDTGEILKFESLYDLLLKKFPDLKIDPYSSHWEQNLNSTHEILHIGALNPVSVSMHQGDEIFAPVGSYLLVSNHLAAGVYVIDHELDKILNWRRVTGRRFFHDAQVASPTELMIFVNNLFSQPISKDEEAKFIFYDVFKRKVIREYNGDFFAYFSGGLQRITKDLYLISDMGSKHGKINRPEFDDANYHFRKTEHYLNKARVTLYSLKNGVQQRIDFDFINQHFKIQKLDLFLKNNISI